MKQVAGKQWPVEALLAAGVSGSGGGLAARLVVEMSAERRDDPVALSLQTQESMVSSNLHLLLLLLLIVIVVCQGKRPPPACLFANSLHAAMQLTGKAG